MHNVNNTIFIKIERAGSKTGNKFISFPGYGNEFIKKILHGLYLKNVFNQINVDGHIDIKNSCRTRWVGR